MKKYLPLALFALFGLSVQAQTEETPAITLTVGVDGTSRNLTFAATEAGHKLQIDWGDGKLVETEEIAVDDEYSSSTTVSGIAVGDGNIKIYGEGIAMFDCSYAVGTTKVTALDVTNAPDLNEITMNSNEVKTIDLSNNGKLTDLTCSNNPITELDLSANTMLENLEATDMQLETIDLTNNVNLTDVRLNNNKVTELDFSKNTALERAYLLNNLIEDIKLPASDSFVFLNLTNNQLTTLDLTGCDALTTLYCANNHFTLATLPAVAYKTYNYAPQKAMQIQETIKTGETLDLSALDNLTGLADAPQTTVYTWTTESGTGLVKGTDYTEEGGKFTFLKAQNEPVYCSMTTEAFPKFSGANAFKTTAINVTDGSATVETPAITLTVGVDGTSRNLMFAATEAGHKLQIDWGDGKLVETEEIAVDDEYSSSTTVSGIAVGNGNIKIYGEGIAMFDCSYAVGTTKVTALDVTNAPDLNEITMNSNEVKTIDLSNNGKLTDLTCSNNPIAELDLSANTMLENLEATDMQLEAIDLTHNVNLTDIRLNNNKVTKLDLSKNTALERAYLLNNLIEDIKLPESDSFVFLNLTNNQLTTLDLTGCDALTTLYCANNHFTLATLPAVAYKTYNYAPQKAMQIQETIKTGETLDLSALDNLTGLADAPQATVYTWTTESGTGLVKGTDYTEEGGKFTFLKAQSEPVYCSMTTEAFPKFSGANAFKTTAINVTDGSATVETPAITLTVGVDGTSRNLTFAATEAGHKLQIDWGDGKLVETEEIAVDDEYSSSTTVSGIAVGDGNIKIYGEGIAMFDCSYAVGTTKVTALDVTNAPDLNEITMNSNEVKTIDLSNNGKLTDLTCSNNPITELDLSANTMLENLEATDMQLEAIDLTHNVNLTDIRLNNNKVTKLDLSKNTALERAYLLNNLIEDIKLPASDSFVFLNLTNNQLTTLDLTGCDALTTLYCANNHFTLATLPAVAYKTYNYAPQKAMQIQETIKAGETLDLSALDNLTGLADAPQATVYTWTTESGTGLVKGTDYTEEGGKFTFLKAQSEPVYCSMTTEAFPKFSGANAFKTTAIEIQAGTVGIDAVNETTPVISGNKGIITVHNLSASSTVEIFDLSGQKVAGQANVEGRVTFSVRPSLYIVRVNGIARKVNAI